MATSAFPIINPKSRWKPRGLWGEIGYGLEQAQRVFESPRQAATRMEQEARSEAISRQRRLDTFAEMQAQQDEAFRREQLGEEIRHNKAVEEKERLETPHTTVVGGKVMQWNPASKRYDIEIGPAPEPRAEGREAFEDAFKRDFELEQLKAQNVPDTDPRMAALRARPGVAELTRFRKETGGTLIPFTDIYGRATGAALHSQTGEVKSIPGAAGQLKGAMAEGTLSKMQSVQLVQGSFDRMQNAIDRMESAKSVDEIMAAITELQSQQAQFGQYTRGIGGSVGTQTELDVQKVFKTIPTAAEVAALKFDPSGLVQTRIRTKMGNIRNILTDMRKYLPDLMQMLGEREAGTAEAAAPKAGPSTGPIYAEDTNGILHESRDGGKTWRRSSRTRRK